jgi:hypothetical protein
MQPNLFDYIATPLLQTAMHRKEGRRIMHVVQKLPAWKRKEKAPLVEMTQPA